MIYKASDAYQLSIKNNKEIYSGVIEDLLDIIDKAICEAIKNGLFDTYVSFGQICNKFSINDQTTMQSIYETLANILNTFGYDVTFHYNDTIEFSMLIINWVKH